MLTEATIFRGAFWFSLGAAFERVMYFLLPVFIAPLGPINLGIFYLSLRIFHSIVSFPAGALNAQYAHKLRQYIEGSKSLRFEETAASFLKGYFLVGILLGAFFFILILLFAPLKSLTFLAVAIPFAIVNSYMMLLLRLLQRFKKIFIIQAVFVFLFLLLYMAIFIGFFKMGIAAAFAGQLLGAILISITAFFFIFDRINLLGLFYKLNLKMLRVSPLPFANALFSTVFPITDLVLVGLLFGSSSLGHYVVLLYLPLLMHKFPTTLFSMFLHVAAVKTRAAQDITEISKRVFKWMIIITIPLFIAIIIFPSAILSILFHKAYVKDLAIAQLLAISFFIQSVGWIAGRILLAKKKIFLYAATNYGSLFVFLLLALFLGTRFGLFGIALAYFIFSITDAFAKYILVVTKANVLFIDWDHMKILCAGTMGAILAYILFFNNPLLSFPFFLILYFAILLMSGVVNGRTLLELKKMVAKEVAIEEPEYE